MAGQYSVFATHRGKKVKKVLWVTSLAAVAFILGNMVLGGTRSSADDGPGRTRNASHYGVETIAESDADESRIKQAAEARAVLSSDEKNDQLVIAGMPANPFRGASSVAYGAASSGRLSIEVSASDQDGSADNGTTSGSAESATTGSGPASATETTQTQASAPASAASQSSSNAAQGVPETDSLDGYEVGQSGGQSSPSSARMSAESKAAADAAAKFVTAYTNYDATKTNAEAFTQGLPALTPDTRAQVLKQTRAQWDRLAKDHRVSEGKIEGAPSMSVPAEGTKAIVTIQVAIKEYGQTTNDQYRSIYTITMVKNNNEWLVDGVTANNL